MPLFDIEQRKDVMGRESFNMLINFQTVSTILHLMLLNNNLDKSMIFFAPATLLTMFAGIVQSNFGIYDSTKGLSNETFQKYKGFIFATVVMAMIVFTIFLHMQKKIHKEVFLGLKN